MKYILSILVLAVVIGCSSKENKPTPQAVDCKGAWSACNGECGEGKGSQLFMVTQAAQNGGAACEAQNGAPRACTASVCAPSVGKDAELCKPEGKKFHCGTNEWWHLSCTGNEKAEQVYFESKQAVAAKADALAMSGCVKVFFLPPTGPLPSPMPPSEEIVHFGFGPCLPCSEMGLAKSKSLSASATMSAYEKAVEEYKAAKAQQQKMLLK